MKRLTWFLLMTVPLLIFLGISFLINKFILIQPIRSILGIGSLVAWVFYSLIVWTIPDREGGFRR